MGKLLDDLSKKIHSEKRYIHFLTVDNRSYPSLGKEEEEGGALKIYR